ncbi:hypothetical protein UY3_18372 [Chelonia mydas]|uniref:Uncharacterized protein n=1 Tax=Chelonia mydas TaxID=8469 RepID=M7B8H3_CHEMY|nr:hypothetical protein UY3_18372 [Chelonia mydas]
MLRTGLCCLRDAMLPSALGTSALPSCLELKNEGHALGWDVTITIIPQLEKLRGTHFHGNQNAS